jgi:hypothetical protein
MINSEVLSVQFRSDRPNSAYSTWRELAMVCDEAVIAIPVTRLNAPMKEPEMAAGRARPSATRRRPFQRLTCEAATSSHQMRKTRNECERRDYPASVVTIVLLRHRCLDAAGQRQGHYTGQRGLSPFQTREPAIHEYATTPVPDPDSSSFGEVERDPRGRKGVCVPADGTALPAVVVRQGLTFSSRFMGVSNPRSCGFPHLSLPGGQSPGLPGRPQPPTPTPTPTSVPITRTRWG